MSQKAANDAQASKFMREGNKWMSTTMFRWNPDYYQAANAYTEAARLYKKNQDLSNYAAAQTAVGTASYKQGRLLKGAQELDTAAMTIVNLDGDAKLAGSLYEKSAEWYLEKTSIDRAGRTLVKAAKCVQKTDTKEAARFALKAMKVYPIPNKGRRVQNMDTYNTVLGLLIRTKNFQEADECIVIQLKHLNVDPNEYNRYIYKAWSARAVLALSDSNFDRCAKIIGQTFEQVTAYGETPWGKCMRKLVNALAHAKTDTFNAIMKGPEFKALDNQVARLARKIELDSKSYEQKGVSKVQYEALNDKITEICGALEVDEEGRVVAQKGSSQQQIKSEDLDLTGGVEGLDLT